MLFSICPQIWKTQQQPQDWKRSVFILIPKKGSPKEFSNYCTIALISHASKVTFKILKASLQQYMNWELPDVQAGFKKGRGTRDQIANICYTIEKAREFQRKHLLLPYWLHQSLSLCGSLQIMENPLRDRNTWPPTCLLRNLYAGKEATVRTGHGTMDWFQIRKGVHQGVYRHPAYLTYTQSTSCEMPGWVKYKLESRFPGEISITSDI